MATIIGFSDSFANNISSDSSYIDDYSSEILTRPEITGLQLLSNCLELMFDSPESFYSDAKLIISGGREIPFHRCVLSARSSVFKTALVAAKQKSKSSAIVRLELKEIAKDYEVGFDAVVTVLAYFYSGRVRLFPVKEGGLCCMDNDCCHVACRPIVDFMVEILYLAFVFQIPELMTMYERHFLEIVDKVVVEDTFVIFKLADICGKAYKKLLDKCIEIIVKSNIESVTLDKSLPQHIVKQIIDIRKEFDLKPEVDKHVIDMYKALDSDDVELVKMLLTEGHTNLDDAYALHYAIAHCDVKTATDLINLEELVDVNHRNQRGYTMLHVAAMRMEPKLIVSLLIKGANASETTFDGKTALMIVKRLTKRDAYNTTTEPGKPTPKGGLCIEVLEQANKLDPFHGEALLSLPVTPDELKMRLLYLENRVALARLLFPAEAQVVMDIAQMEGTREFTASSIEHDRAERTLLDLNTTPFRFQEEHLSRLIALSRTVELGKRYFPRCSLDHFMDIEDFAHLGCIDTPEKRLQKKQRYMELQETLMKTFSEDKEEFGKSSKSKSTGVMRSRRMRMDKRKF